MKLGTIAYNGEIYNLDYMNSDEIKKILDDVETNKTKKLNDTEYLNNK